MSEQPELKTLSQIITSLKNLLLSLLHSEPFALFKPNNPHFIPGGGDGEKSLTGPQTLKDEECKSYNMHCAYKHTLYRKLAELR